MTEQIGRRAAPIQTTPNVARMYDYLLGGKDNFGADRAAAKRLIEANPDVAGIARQ